MAIDRQLSFPQRGITIVECVAATMILGVVATSLVQATVSLERTRRAAERRDYASRELENLLERFLHRPWDEITSQTAAALQPPEEVAERLPDARLEAMVFDETEPLDAKRVTMQLRWRVHANATAQPLVLTAWVFRDTDRGEEETP